MHPASIDPEQLMQQCQLRRLRRGGPGGQHRNKVSTAVQLEHLPSGIQAEANESRVGATNQRVALRRLRLLLACRHRQPVSPQAAPSPLWLTRLIAGRLSVATEHVDFPALLAEALDRIEACQGHLPEAAQGLQTTPSQLISLVKRHPAAWQQLNAERQSRGLSRLQ
jgi:hypothetical protein